MGGYKVNNFLFYFLAFVCTSMISLNVINLSMSTVWDSNNPISFLFPICLFIYFCLILFFLS